jgi:hypothetical protein
LATESIRSHSPQTARQVSHPERKRETDSNEGRNVWATVVTEVDMQNSLEMFKPKFLNDLIRVGGAFDGGYVVNERSIRSSRYLMSFGVNDDWSFEAKCLSRKPNLKVLCFDHTVSKRVFLNKILDALSELLSVRFLLLVLSLDVRGVRRELGVLKYWTKIYFGFSFFFAKENVRFCSKGISSETSQRFVTLDDAFQMISREALPENSVFIKMDIEQSEFRVLPDLLRFEEYIAGMVVEFHDLDILWPKFSDLMNELKAYFEITHIHGNNYGGLILNSRTPKVLEITFLKKSLIRGERPARENVAYPIPELDRPNDRFADDYRLVF